MHSLSLLVVAGLALAAQSGSDNALPTPAPPTAPAATPLERALAAARVSGKPLLVIVTGPEVRAPRGRWLSDLSVIGGDESFAQLALVEVVFATRSQLLAALPTDLRGAAQSCEVGLVDVLSGTPEFVSVLDEPTRAALAEQPDSDRYGEGIGELSASLDRRLYELSQRTEVVRVRVARARLTAEQLRDLELALADVHRADTDVAVCAAWCYCQPGYFGEGRSGYRGNAGRRTDLANALRAEWEKQPPYGARFAEFDGSRWRVHASPADDARERSLLDVRAQEMEPRSLSRVVERRACNGPCGSGHSTVVGYEFLDEYTRVLVDATDLD